MIRLLIKRIEEVLQEIVFFLGGNPILCTARKQHTVSKSSTEVEYKALAFTAIGVTWLMRILNAVSVSPALPLRLYCDNVSAIALTANSVFHARTKHIEVDFHFVRQKTQRK